MKNKNTSFKQWTTELKRLQEYKIKNDLSLNSIARETGLNAATVMRIFSGESIPSVVNYYLILNHFGMKPN